MYSLSNSLLSFSCNYFIRESRILESKLGFTPRLFLQKPFFLIGICIVTRLLYDVTIPDHFLVLIPRKKCTANVTRIELN